MNKLVAGLVILVLAVFAVYFASTLMQKQQDASTANQNLDSIPDINLDDSTSWDPNVPLPEFVPCEKRESSGSKDLCYRDTALEKSDETICQKISDAGGKNSCIIAVATDESDITLCNLMPNQRAKNWCIETVAVENDLQEYCNSIVDVSPDAMKGRCMAQTNTPCEELIVQADRDSCYSDKALYSGNETICQKVLSIETKNKCITMVADSKMDIKLCDLTSTRNAKDLCIQTVATDNENPDFCQSISAPDIKENCIQQTTPAE